jgi:outer membrane autotransporter protein
VIGNVDLGGGDNRFDNLGGAIVQSGALFSLGVGHTLSNAGLVAPGGSEFVQTTALSGNFVQSEPGTLAMDIDLAHIVADHLEVSGAAQLAGALVANPLNKAYAKPGRYDHVAVTTQDGAVNTGLNLLAPPTTAVVRYDLVQPNAQEIAVQSEVNFSPGALGDNSRRLGTYINAIQSAGGSESFAPIALALMDLPDAQSLEQAYDGLIPEVQANLGLDTVSSSLFFNDTLHSCRQREGDYRFAKEGDCVWARVEGGGRDQERSSQNPGYQTDTVTISTGLQREMQPGSHLGFALSYQDVDLDSARAGSDGSRLAGGVIVKHQVDAVTVSASLGLGYGSYDSERRVDLPTPGVKASSEQDVYFASLHGRVGYDFMPTENFYIRPLVDLGFTHVNRRGFTEEGAGAANLKVSGEKEMYSTIRPAVEIGGETELAGGLQVRPYAQVGMTHYLSSNRYEITARMEGAPAGVDPFTISVEDERTFADLALGVDLIKKDGINLRFNYSGQFSGQSASHVGGVKLAIPF